jgi:hypothetical protein
MTSRDALHGPESRWMGELRVALKGPDAHLGEVPARDVANLILGVERVVMLAASVVLGRPKTGTGRGEAVIEQAARLKLRAVEEGSVTPVLELPEPAVEESALDLGDASLTELSISSMLNTVETGEGPVVVMDALLDLGAERIRVGERYESIEFDFNPSHGRPTRRISLDGARVKHLRRSMESARAHRSTTETLTGTLVEADFEKLTARLRGPLRELIIVAFDETHADEIQHALRHEAAVQGRVTYDPKTFTARHVELRTITHGEQLVLGIDADEFWSERSIEELAGRADYATDVSELYDPSVTDYERETFMMALADLKE